jgi:hypothetical protein
MAIDFDRFWENDEYEPKPPGVSEQQLAAWEARQDVRLPHVLRAALGRQNGGLVRYSYVRILPLEEIAAPDEPFWQSLAEVDREAADRKLVFTFAWHEDGEPRYLINFNGRGRAGEPTVHNCWKERRALGLEAKTLAEFFSGLLAVEAAPAIDWSETTRLDVVLHHEALDLSTTAQGAPPALEIVLGRVGGRLVLYTHSFMAGLQSYTKTTLPEPLNVGRASITKYRPNPTKAYGMDLEPQDSQGIVSVAAEQFADGQWKNSTDRGSPTYMTVGSTSKERLKNLQEALFGKAPAPWWKFW